MADKKIKRTIDSLKAIYAVIIGLAMKEAIQKIAEQKNSNTITSILLLVTFFSFAVPFFHGMNRHLEEYYIESKTKPKQLLLFIDFMAFLLEACFLFFFAINLCVYWLGFKFLGLMIFVDLVWALLLYKIARKDKNKTSSNLKKWSFLDIGTLVGLLLLYYTFLHRFNVSKLSSTALICIFSVLRTIIDFKISWKFYFPEEDEDSDSSVSDTV